jgi:uncharacterized protein
MQARRSSFAALQSAVGPLLSNPGDCHIAARATVLAQDGQLQARFEDILKLGFTEVGFAPLRKVGSVAVFDDGRWSAYLEQLIHLSRQELGRAEDGAPIRLTNLAIALKQLHRGFASPYACGAGGGYFSVAADGDWYACHRAIGEDSFRLGDTGGLDKARRLRFLRDRHVHAQMPCRTCWARYLCSGGCHQEAPTRTSASCDFIRAWLEFCLTAYVELSAARPDFFSSEPTRGSH